MSVNRYRPHVMVLPEDDANRQLANGFLLGVPLTFMRNIQVLEAAGGWMEVLNRFRADHIVELRRYSSRFMVLLIDFDGQGDRLKNAKDSVPDDLADRVFVMGVWSEPEALRAALGSYETIGRALAKDCGDDTNTTWGHELLQHNATELDRMRQRIRPLLFVG